MPWSAVTCRRFVRMGDLSPKQIPENIRGSPNNKDASLSLDGDKSPAESADKSTHSKARNCHAIHPCSHCGFRFHSLCGILIVLPPTNSRTTASPGMMP